MPTVGPEAQVWGPGSVALARPSPSSLAPADGLNGPLGKSAPVKTPGGVSVVAAASTSTEIQPLTQAQRRRPETATERHLTIRKSKTYCVNVLERRYSNTPVDVSSASTPHCAFVCCWPGRCPPENHPKADWDFLVVQ